MKPKKALIAPSLLSADFSKLAQEVEAVEKAGADWLHIDVMDGHFVPNLTIGPLVVEALRPHTQMPMDCHLMVERPENWIAAFAEAGADIITVHAEATVHLHRLVHQIKEAGCSAGVSINPGTSLESLEEILDQVDLVLIMSVNPGFGGQQFIQSSLDKIERLAQMRAQTESRFVIEVDGGVSVQNIAELRKAGADIFVAGSAVFGQSDRAAALKGLHRALEKADSAGPGESKKRKKSK